MVELELDFKDLISSYKPTKLLMFNKKGENIGFFEYF